MRMHRCAAVGCRELIPTYHDYCDKHYNERLTKWRATMDAKRASGRDKVIQHRYNATKRDPERNAFYRSSQWHKVREYVYARDNATCQVCGNVVTDRKIVDHIHPLKLSPEDKLDTSNLWVLCYGCHKSKTRLEQSIEVKPHGNGILRHANRDWWYKVLTERRNKQE